MVLRQTKTLDLNLLSETIGLMNKADDFQVISEIIFNFIKNFVSYNMAVIYQVKEKAGVLEIVSCIGSDAEKMKERVPFRVGQGAVGLVARDKKVLLINDVLDSKEIRVRQYHNEDPVIRSFLAVPLIVGDNVIGILSVSSSNPHEYNQYDVQMINIVASQCAVLLELNNNITEAKSFSNQILENVNSGVMVVNDKYEIITFNKSAEGITGYSLGEVLGKSIVDIPLKERYADWSIIESMETGKILFEEPGYMVRKDGKYVRIRLSTSLIYDEDKNLKSCICIFRDTTEIEELQKQIAMAEKLAALGRITSGITHEIRNPLLPIRSASEYLLKKYDGERSEEINKLLNIIREESERLNRFLEQLVSLNKDTFFAIGECNLAQALEETLLLLNYGIRKNGIELNVDMDSKEIITPLNADNLKQIFLNIMLNSIDAIGLKTKEEAKEINIRVVSEYDYSIIEIVDTGIGMPKDELTKVFDPFYTTKEDGTGIGLPIIHNIITSSGGKISIESELNKGTKVTLLLPRV